MTSYKENPGLPMTVVDTIGGEKEYRKNCRSVKGNYYIKDKDIYFIEEENTWYFKKSTKVDYDWEKNCVYLKGTKLLTTGVVGFDSDGKPVIGLFTENPYNNCKVQLPNSATYPAISPDVLITNNYFEDVASNKFYSVSAVSRSDMSAMQKIRPSKTYTNKGYNIEDNKEEFERKKILYRDYNMKIGEDAKTYGKFLTDITYGAELECSVGACPDFVQNRHGLVSCRDGSLEGGPEWVTVPMSGAKGIQNLIELGKELRKRNEIDIRCAYHIHIGNLPTERVYLVALYMLSYTIQDEVFKMFPGYKLQPEGIKRKNYCQKLKKMSIYSLKDSTKEGYDQFVNSVYEKIYEFLSDGHAADLSVNRRQQRHPIEAKFNRSSRYFWQNFQNLLFSPRVTTEMRMSSPTLNPQRLINWLMISNAIVKYAEYNMKKIIMGERITFKDVLNVYKDHWKGDKDASFLSSYLTGYYDERCAAFKKDLDKGDLISDWEIKADSSYKFTYEGKSLFLK